jgi:hypothetical protein
VFHFLTGSEDLAQYRRHLLETLKLGGTAIMATFAPDGLEKCSGLPVERYAPEQLTSPQMAFIQVGRKRRDSPEVCLAERVGFELSQVLWNLQLTETTLPRLP